MSHWVKAVTYTDLQKKQRMVFRHQGKQIALFDTANGIFACNNRCPHEGYPLREGSLADGCLLTCNWHNWKFDLRSGENLYGGDQVRVYPTDLRDDGAVWINLAEPPFEVRRDKIMANLRAAFDDHEYDRLARELGRLKLLGADPLEAVSTAIDWSYQRFEFGWTHAYAGAADWLALYDEHTDDAETQLICLLETLGHIADDVLRESEYPYSEDQQPLLSENVFEDAFVAAIDAENETAAIAMLRGALAAGLHFPELERALTRAALLHYSDFGHSLIYVSKTGRLIERLGEHVELPLLLSLVRSLIFAWREDLIPEFRSYAPALAAWGKNADSNLPSVAAYRELSIEKALNYTVQNSKAPTEQIFQTLLGANAAHLLHYDMSYQFQTNRPVSENVGWLSFTHGITFANAVHKQCQKFPELWPAGLLQMACFSGRNKPYTDANLDASEWSVDDPQAFLERQIDTLFDHGKEEYIVSVHLLKTLLAVREELQLGTTQEVEQILVAALNRFLHSPLKRKHTRRTAYQALAFVAKDA